MAWWPPIGQQGRHVLSVQRRHVLSEQCRHVLSVQRRHVLTVQCRHVLSVQCRHLLLLYLLHLVIPFGVSCYFLSFLKIIISHPSYSCLLPIGKHGFHYWFVNLKAIHRKCIIYNKKHILKVHYAVKEFVKKLK